MDRLRRIQQQRDASYVRNARLVRDKKRLNARLATAHKKLRNVKGKLKRLKEKTTETVCHLKDKLAVYTYSRRAFYDKKARIDARMLGGVAAKEFCLCFTTKGVLSCLIAILRTSQSQGHRWALMRK